MAKRGIWAFLEGHGGLKGQGEDGLTEAGLGRKDGQRLGSGYAG